MAEAGKSTVDSLKLRVTARASRFRRADPSPLPFFVSAEYKRLTGGFPVSVDSAQLEIACYQWTNLGFVSADSKGVKVLGLEYIASADSKRVKGRPREAVRVGSPRLEAKTHDLGYHDLLP